MEQMLTWFRRYLWVWGVLMVAHFLYVNAVLADPAPPYTDLWRVWHPYWFNILYATTLLIPFLLFTRPIAAWFGGLQSAVGRSMLLLGLGGAVWGLGNGVWFIYNVRGSEAPYPSWADAGFLGMLPLATVALLSLTSLVGLGGRDYLRFGWIPVVALAVTAYLAGPEVNLLGWDLGSEWLFSADNSVPANTISAFYIVLDVLLLSFAVMLALRAREAVGGVFLLPVVTVVGALIAQYLGDMFFFHRVADETYFNADFSDGLYAASMFLIVASAYQFGRAYRKMSSGIGEVATT